MHLVGSGALAGTERHALGLVEELRRQGCAAELACPPGESALRSEARAIGVPVLPASRPSRRPRAEIVHVHDGRSALVGALLAAATRAALVRTQHFVRPASAERDGWRGRSSLKLHRLLNRRLDGYIAVSQAAAGAAVIRRDVAGTPIAVIAPGIRLAGLEQLGTASTARARSRHLVIVTAGRLEEERRIDVLLDAMPRLLAAVPDCRLVIAGAGNAERRLNARARELGIADGITWTGWLPDISPVLAMGHVYVNTWPWEGFGIATAEAMGFGLPVIATNAGASPELVEDGISGRLVPPLDPVALATALGELLADREQAARMGARGRLRAEQGLSVAATAAATLRFYERLVQDGGGRLR